MQKLFVALFAAWLGGAAMAQAPSAADVWVSRSLNSRGDKSWRPQVVASPEVAAKYPNLGGQPVAADGKLAPGTIEIRTRDVIKLHNPNDPLSPPDVPVGGAVARMTGVR